MDEKQLIDKILKLQRYLEFELEKIIDINYISDITKNELMNSLMDEAEIKFNQIKKKLDGMA